jgi:hypothetical protein
MSADNTIRSKVIFDGKNSKPFFASIKILLGLAHVMKDTNFMGHELDTQAQHQAYLTSLNANNAAARLKKENFERALLIIQNNIDPEKLPSYVRYDAFQFLQYLYKQTEKHTYLQQSTLIENRLLAVKEEYTSHDRADLMLLDYAAINTLAVGFGNGLDTNLGAALFIHASRISKKFEDHLNIWQMSLPGTPESFTFEAVHDEIQVKV